ncbi:MAG: ShlB/FhaC/HecB family hemolysin secretion/activation protein [Verrucomicrobiaceae bacterium]|nr:ShlB/FhaC/HecB family hemolysin secretion/activation protein [Verrucomicrobiaceae bacterium]
MTGFTPSATARPIIRQARSLAFAACFGLVGSSVKAQEAPPPPPQPTEAPATTPTALSQVGPLYIQEYRVRGNKILKPIDIEKAVYPYLGPGRSENDIEQARQGLEKAYRGLGYQTVYVEVPKQTGARGVIYLNVVEAPVGRLRVKGAKYFLPSKIKEKAQSMAEGTVPNFNEVQKEIVALNRWRDRKITPELRAGVVPGTVDIDLIVEDKNPFHGNLELNNVHNANTVPLRLNGSLSYSNLWQLGHTLGASFQVAPEKTSDGTVFSGYYMAPLENDWSVMVTGAWQDSNISTLGGGTVVGKGQIYGIRFMKTLPAEKGWFHSLSAGMDYKDFIQDVNAGGAVVASPIVYYPITLSYSMSHVQEHSFTEFNAALVFHLRGMGGSENEFRTRRFAARDNFFYLRGDLSHTHDLPGDLQLYTRIQGQASGSPLINTEQIAAGGINTVRGYLIATQLGDSGIMGSMELRSPSFIGDGKDKANDWRAYAFAEAAQLYVNNTLPGEKRTHSLASIGVGTRIRWQDHLYGSFDLGIPLVTQPDAIAQHLYMTFRVGADF